MTVGPCRHPDCDAPAVVAGRLCLPHARQAARRHRPSRTRPGVCKVDGCDDDAHARGWCTKHYHRWYRHGDPTVTVGRGHRGPDRGCTIDGCQTEHYARGWCRKHWHRWWKHGDPHHVADPGPPKVREGCRVDGCDGNHSARGLCNRHYQRWYAGDPDLQDVALEPVPYLAGEGQGEGSTPASNNSDP